MIELGDIIIAVVALVFSALFSAYEISFLSSNKLIIELDRKEGQRYAIAMQPYLQNPDKLISSLLMGNNVVMVIYGLAMANILNPVIERYITENIAGVLLLETAVATIIVLITGEFMPKTVSRINPNGVFKWFYLPVLFFHYLFYPLTAFARLLSLSIMKLFGFNALDTAKNQSFDKTDLMHLAEEIDIDEDEEEEYEFSNDDIDIFKNALKLSTVKMRECMVPRTELAAIEIDDSVEELLRLFIDTGYSRIMVYKENVDNIVGYVHSKDLFAAKCNSIGEVLRQIDFVDEEMSAQSLLATFTANRKSVAVVRDEYGGTAGIVTLEDLIEEIFGDIDDELDKEEYVEKMISEKEYVFSARLEVEELNKKYNLGLPDNDAYETLGGLIVYHAEHIPKEKEIITIDSFSFTILKCDKNRVDKVLLKIK